jgi:hypothetical protein
VTGLKLLVELSIEKFGSGSDLQKALSMMRRREGILTKQEK